MNSRQRKNLRPEQRVIFSRQKRPSTDSKRIAVRYEFSSSAFFMGGSLFVWIFVAIFVMLFFFVLLAKSNLSFNI